MTNTFPCSGRLTWLLMRIEQPSGSVGSIDSPTTRMIRQARALSPSRSSQRTGNFIPPVIRFVVDHGAGAGRRVDLGYGDVVLPSPPRRCTVGYRGLGQPHLGVCAAGDLRHATGRRPTT